MHIYLSLKIKSANNLVFDFIVFTFVSKYNTYENAYRNTHFHRFF